MHSQSKKQAAKATKIDTVENGKEHKNRIKNVSKVRKITEDMLVGENGLNYLIYKFQNSRISDLVDVQTVIILFNILNAC